MARQLIFSDLTKVLARSNPAYPLRPISNKFEHRFVIYFIKSGMIRLENGVNN